MTKAAKKIASKEPEEVSLENKIINDRLHWLELQVSMLIRCVAEQQKLLQRLRTAEELPIDTLARK